MIIERVLSSYQSQVMCKKKYDERESWSSFVHTWKTTAFCSVFDVFSLFALQREFRSYILENDNSRLILSATASLCMYSHKERLSWKFNFKCTSEVDFHLWDLLVPGDAHYVFYNPLCQHQKDKEKMFLFFSTSHTVNLMSHDNDWGRARELRKTLGFSISSWCAWQSFVGQVPYAKSEAGRDVSTT